MKTKNFNLLFYLKKVKSYESGNLPIYLRISVDGKRSEATIGRGIEPEKWDEKRGKRPSCLRTQVIALTDTDQPADE